MDTFLESRNKEFHKPKICVKLHNLEYVGRICREIIEGGADNPFPGGGLSIHLNMGNRHQVISLLDKFGEKVRHLHLVMHEMPTVFLQLLKDCLERTPYLKGIYIQGDLEQEIMYFAPSVRLPVLKGLETLQLQIFNNVHWKIARIMLGHVFSFSNPITYLKKLHLQFGNIENVVHMLPFCHNLEELELVLNDKVTALHQAKIFKSPLEILTLDMRNVDEVGRGLSLRNILSIRNRASSSLKKLRVVAPIE